MPNVVFDANVLVSAALNITSTPAQALLLAIEQDLVVFSETTFAEISAVLARPKFSFLGSRRDEFLALIAPHQAFFEPGESIKVCRDPKDDAYLEVAVASDAWAIVSGDDDLLVLDPFRSIRILRPAEYLASVMAR
jgi:uncharacterized protein